MLRREVLMALSALAGTGGARAALPADKGLVGVSMPTMSLLRWVYDGLGMMRALVKMDYRVDLKFGNDEIPTQIAQLEAMLDNKARALVVGAIDGTALAPVLGRAAKMGVKVLSYDRLMRNTPDIDVYATFDNFQVGVLQASDIESRLKLKERAGPHTIELFAGSADDNNTHMFFNGAMSVLKPSIESGALVVGSGRTAMAEVSTPRWNGALAKARLQTLLTTTYAKRRLDAILSPNDGISVELVAALRSVGYGQAAQPWPVVTGQDADLAAVRSIARGEQSSTVFKDTRDLVLRAASMVDEMLSGKAPTINDVKTYHNGVKVVPSYLLKPVLVNQSNWRALLVDSGYYKKEQI